MRRDREVRPRVKVRVLIAASVIALAYPLSLGPVCWMMSRLQWDQHYPSAAFLISRAYLPLAPMIINGPPPIQAAFKGWIGLGMALRTTFHDWPLGVGWSNPGCTYTLWHY
jgi:hypothetical protein